MVINNCIELKNVSIEVGAGKQEKKKIIQDVSVKIQKGDFVIITGRSGSGKSTLMNLMSGLLAPTSGEVFVKGKKIKDFTLSLTNSLLQI